MNYLALAEHLAARCRKYLNATVGVTKHTQPGDVIINRPEKSDDDDSYFFGMMKTSERSTEPEWMCFVYVFPDHGIVVDNAGYDVPSDVLTCLKRYADES